MAGSKVLQFCLLISFMIFSTHALTLRVFLTDGLGKRGYKYKTVINFRMENGMRHFDGCARNKTYTAGPATTKVIVYIKNDFQMTKTTLKECCKGIRKSIANVLRDNNLELLYLAVVNFRSPFDERVIGEFLRWAIRPYPGQTNFQINTIGEGDMNVTYETSSGNLTVYQEDSGVFGGNLQGFLENIHNELCLTHLLSDDVFDFAESGADIDSE